MVQNVFNQNTECKTQKYNLTGVREDEILKENDEGRCRLDKESVRTPSAIQNLYGKREVDGSTWKPLKEGNQRDRSVLKNNLSVLNSTEANDQNFFFKAIAACSSYSRDAKG